MTRTNRLFALMQALRSRRPPVTAQQLAYDTGVSLRTLYRDIESLRGMGAIIDGTAGYGYALTEDASLPPMMFDDEEIEALVLGLREVQAIGDSDLARAAAAALSKLQARLPSAQAHRLEHAVLAVAQFRKATPTTVNLRELRQATWDENTLSIAYCDAKGTPTNRDVDPLGIMRFEQNHALIAWCHLRQDYRAFRLDRIQNFTPTGANFRPRRVPMLRDALALMTAQPFERAEIRTTDAAPPKP